MPVMKMQCVWPSRPCLGASDRTSSMCLQAAPRVKAEEANHPRSYSPKRHPALRELHGIHDSRKMQHFNCPPRLRWLRVLGIQGDGAHGQ